MMKDIAAVELSYGVEFDVLGKVALDLFHVPLVHSVIYVPLQNEVAFEF